MSESRINDRIILRDVAASDLPIFFEHQSDVEAVQMAAFTAKDPTDRAAFDAHWQRIMDDNGILIQTIVFNGQVAGHVLRYGDYPEQELSYWLGREYWGKGIATAAVAAFLELCEERPLYARAAKDNTGSIRVLEKCGFTLYGEDRGFANARGEEIAEVILKLE